MRQQVHIDRPRPLVVAGTQTRAGADPGVGEVQVDGAERILGGLDLRGDDPVLARIAGDRDGTAVGQLVCDRARRIEIEIGDDDAGSASDEFRGECGADAARRSG